MSDRVYASVFYLALVIGSSWLAVTVGEALTRAALTNLALVQSPNPKPSRVDVFLAAQDRSAIPENAKDVVVPAAPPVQIGALAKAMDDAERPGTLAPPEAEKPRVAGWSKRLPRRALSGLSAEETSGRLIMRSLRAEM